MTDWSWALSLSMGFQAPGILSLFLPSCQVNQFAAVLIFGLQNISKQKSPLPFGFVPKKERKGRSHQSLAVEQVDEISLVLVA